DVGGGGVLDWCRHADGVPGGAGSRGTDCATPLSGLYQSRASLGGACARNLHSTALTAADAQASGGAGVRRAPGAAQTRRGGVVRIGSYALILLLAAPSAARPS